ncbi:MAG: DNA repair protein RecN [Kiritimatiellia bacterium]
MLQSLRIRNLALVEELAVEFGPGFSVLTGETGAGKSIIMGALGLLVGERADKTLIRAGAEQCLVEAALHLSDPVPVDALLTELGLQPTDQGQLVLRRTLSAAGTGRTLVNDASISLQSLKRLGDLLVDMHGPHDHQSLLSPDYQLRLLDSFGRLDALLNPYATLYHERRELEARRHELEGDEQAFAREMDFLAFQVQELGDAKLEEGEDEALIKEHAGVAGAQQALEAATGLLDALSEGEASALQALAAVQQQLERLGAAVPQAAEWKEEARRTAIQVKELASSIASYAQSVDADPARLQWLEERMSLYHRLKRKYNASVPELLEQHQTARTRLHELQTRHERIAELAKQEAATLAKLRQAGLKLRTKRKETAGKLADAVTRQLRDLGFARAGFEVNMAETEPAPAGLDAVEFGFAPNPGEPFRPLRAIASSGEISRVMLAVKTVLAAHDRIPILVFDEIDANIGGETATAVGRKLAELAATHQVIAITHMPQVAVHGRRHYAVRKTVTGDRTRSSIDPLDDSARAEEIARMLGGKGLTTVVLQHAREMLQKAARK